MSDLPELDAEEQRVLGSLLINNVWLFLVVAGRFVVADALVAVALSRHPRGFRAAPLLRLAAHIAMVNGDLTTAWVRCELRCVPVVGKAGAAGGPVTGRAP